VSRVRRKAQETNVQCYENAHVKGRRMRSTFGCSSELGSNILDSMQQPSFVESDMRLLRGSHTYRLETTDPINSPIDFTPVPSSWAIQPSRIRLYRLVAPVQRMCICRGSMSIGTLPFPCLFIHLYLMVSIGDDPNFPGVKSRHPPFT